MGGDWEKTADMWEKACKDWERVCDKWQRSCDEWEKMFWWMFAGWVITLLVAVVFGVKIILR